MVRVPVQPELIEWACSRAGYTIDAFVEKYPDKHVSQWVTGEKSPTLKQLEWFAKSTHAPIGYFFLESPPRESVPIPDYRTLANAGILQPSANLIDTIYICQMRQEWYRRFAQSSHSGSVSYVGELTTDMDPVDAAKHLEESIGYSLEERSAARTWIDALRIFIERIESSGTLVMVNGVVGGNNNRRLDPEEFRGFALSDDFAPLIFVNGADTKSAQMFTLAHEFAHLLLGQTALSDAGIKVQPSGEVEVWCNQVAAEYLVPTQSLLGEVVDRASVQSHLQRLAKTYKVSTLVLIRRLHDVGLLDRSEFRIEYQNELDRIMEIMGRRSGGGNFHHTTAVRVSRLFARSLISSTLEGRATFSEAMRLLGFRKLSTFKDFGRMVGVEI